MRLTKRQKERAKALLRDGASVRAAARGAGISRGGLRGVLERKAGPTQRIGRPPRLTAHEKSIVLDMAAAGKPSASALAAQASVHFGKSVSKSTIGRTLQQARHESGSTP